jgi:hypothetical protein
MKRPRLGGGLPLLAAAFLLTLPSFAAAEISATLADGTLDDVTVTDPALGAQAPIGGYVQIEIRVSGDPVSGGQDQRVSIVDRLPNCLSLMYGRPEEGHFPQQGWLNRLRRELHVWPQQDDMVVTVDGNLLILENLVLPRRGELQVSYWAEIVGKQTVTVDRDGAARRVDTAGVTPIEWERSSRVITSRRVQLQGLAGDGFGPAPLTPESDRLPGLMRDRLPEARTIECLNCCHQVKVVDSEGRLWLSQAPPSQVAPCQPGATGFEVLVPGAMTPMPQ